MPYTPCCCWLFYSPLLSHISQSLTHSLGRYIAKNAFANAAFSAERDDGSTGTASRMNWTELSALSDCSTPVASPRLSVLCRRGQRLRFNTAEPFLGGLYYPELLITVENPNSFTNLLDIFIIRGCIKRVPLYTDLIYCQIIDLPPTM